jgi:hypothetical protein
MSLSNLTDESLDQATLTLVRTEREILSQILQHLLEVERRRLFCKFQMSSLFDYAIKRLGYSEDQAARRISAMRLLKDLPSIETKIESGELTLTHLAKAQTLFRQEKRAERPRSDKQKLALLEKLENTSKREAEQILETEAFIDVNAKSKVGTVALEQFSPELQSKLTRLLEIRSRQNPSHDLESLLNAMADLALKKWDPTEKAKRARSRRPARDEVKKRDAPVPAPVRVNRSRYVPAAIRHLVYLRDQGKCTNCGSRKFLEVDHVHPFSLGGQTKTENLRLLCRSCNQRHAIRSYGVSQITKFLKSPEFAYL